MKLLITGTDGFIGNALYEALSFNYQVDKLTRKECDLADSSAVNNFFKDKSYDIVIHTAIEGGRRTIEDEYKDFYDNISMVYNLLSQRSKYKYLFNFASGAEFDRRRHIDGKYNQLLNSFPIDIYGASKNIISRLLRPYYFCYNFRIYGCFGITELNDRFIKSSLVRYTNKEPIIIHQNKLMDFFYIDDLVAVISYYINNIFDNNNLSNDIDLTYNEKYNLLDIAKKINQLDSYEVPIHIMDKELGLDYIGTPTNLPIKLKGLDWGISEVLSGIRQEYTPL
jgi:nucleoside-diphosphate-sugar epimerase